MAIEIKEYLNATFVECQDYRNDVCSKPINLTESAQFSNRVAPHSLMVEIEGLHSILTRNNTKYTDKAMKQSEKYWTYPYERPVIMHHNESDGITIGRVKNAYWTDVETRSGTGALRFNTNIAHKDGIDGVNNGTLSTVSVGLIAHDVTCSICGKQVELDEDEVPLCGHIRGTTVNGELCYWNINEFEPKELSFVIVPSDPYAHILNVEEVGETKKQNLSESTKSNKEVNKNMHGLFDDLINEANEAIGLSESAKEETSKTKKKDEEAKEDETKKEETKESTESKETDEKEKKEDDNIDNNSSESKEQEENNEEKKDEKNEQQASEEDEGHTESKSDEKVEETEESKPEQKSQAKVIEEDFQKDIDSKKGDIYKDMEMQKKLHDAEMKNKDNEIKNLKRRVAELESKLTTEVKLKESIEGELIKFKTEKKQQLAQQVNDLREQMNVAPEDMKNLMESSEETLHFTIKTLKEMSANSNILNSIQKIKSDVAINENKDNTQKTSSIDVKESSESSNINVEESLIEDILSQAFNSNSYQNFY